MTSGLIDRVRSAGADLQPVGERLRVFHPERLGPRIIDELRREKLAVMRVLEAEREAAGIASVQRLLRESLWPVTVTVCDFLIGRAGEVCMRCGASWMEHYAP